MSDGQAKSGILRATRVLVWLIYAVVAAYSVILSIAFVLQLLGANPSASFVDWIYRSSARIMEPFRGMFPVEQVTSNSVFNASLLFAVILYSLVAMLLHGAVDWLSDRISLIAPRQRPAAPPMAVSAPTGVPAAAPGDIDTATVPRPSPERYR